MSGWGRVVSSVRKREHVSPPLLCREFGTGAKAHRRRCEVNEGGRAGEGEGAGHDLLVLVVPTSSLEVGEDERERRRWRGRDVGEDEGEGGGASSRCCRRRVVAVAWREGGRRVIVVALLAYGMKVGEEGEDEECQWARRVVVVIVGWSGMSERAHTQTQWCGCQGVAWPWWWWWHNVHNLHVMPSRVHA